MPLPSGENRGNVSSPSGELRRTAVPPFFGTTQMSPAYPKAVWCADTAGYRNMRASISADAGAGHMHDRRSAKTRCFIVQMLTSLISKSLIPDRCPIIPRMPQRFSLRRVLLALLVLCLAAHRGGAVWVGGHQAPGAVA